MSAITLQRTDFTRALATVAPVIRKKSTIPVLGAALLTRDGDRLRISGTDLDVQIDATVPAAMNGHDLSATLAMPARIGRAIRITGADTVAIEPGEKLGITAGDLRLSLDGLPAGGWPRLEAEPKDVFSATLPPEAIAALRRVSPAISTEETRYYLNGIHVHRGEGPWAYTAVATDGHRMFMADFPLPDATGDLPASIIIPRAAIHDLLAIAGKEPVRFRLAPKVGAREGAPPLAIFEGEGVRLTAKLIDGTFPDYRRVIPKETPDMATFDRAALCRAVSCFLALGRRDHPAIKLTLSGGAAKLESPWLYRAGGAAESALPYEGNIAGPYIIGINGWYLATALDAFGSCSRITLALAEAKPGGQCSAPFIFASPDDGRLRAIQMPMRV